MANTRGPVPPRGPPMNGGGYAANQYGNSGGNGNNPYGNAPPNQGSRYGAGGYGGMGATSTQDDRQNPYGDSRNQYAPGRRGSNETTTTEDNRQALFGDAKNKYAQANSSQPRGANGPGGAGGDEGGFGYGEDRELTAEEQEEEDLRTTKNEIRDIKRSDVSATRNALQMAAQAEESGRATLARLGAQGERILNTDRNLDLASNSAREGEEKAKELKTLNRSMFAVHVSNPFTSKSRQADRDEQALEKNRAERDQRADTHQAAYQQSMRMEQNFRNLGKTDGPRGKASLAERSKYQFEADSEDEELENEIDKNIDALSGAAGRLKMLSRAVGEEVDAQNKHIDKVMLKSDRVDDQLALNRARLDRMK